MAGTSLCGDTVIAVCVQLCSRAAFSDDMKPLGLAELAAVAKFSIAGQHCVSRMRLLAYHEVYDDFC